MRRRLEGGGGGGFTAAKSKKFMVQRHFVSGKVLPSVFIIKDPPFLKNNFML